MTDFLWCVHRKADGNQEIEVVEKVEVIVLKHWQGFSHIVAQFLNRGQKKSSSEDRRETARKSRGSI